MEKVFNKKRILIRLFIALYILGFSNSCKSQVEIKTSVWTPETSYERKEYNSTITLVFEENFNDSISIYNNDTHLKDLFIKTNKSLGVAPTFYKTQKSNKIDEKIKVVFTELEKEIIFDLKDYSYVYISRENDGKTYYIEYSHFKRKYY